MRSNNIIKIIKIIQIIMKIIIIVILMRSSSYINNKHAYAGQRNSFIFSIFSIGSIVSVLQQSTETLLVGLSNGDVAYLLHLALAFLIVIHMIELHFVRI